MSRLSPAWVIRIYQSMDQEGKAGKGGREFPDSWSLSLLRNDVNKRMPARCTGRADFPRDFTFSGVVWLRVLRIVMLAQFRAAARVTRSRDRYMPRHMPRPVEDFSEDPVSIASYARVPTPRACNIAAFQQSRNRLSRFLLRADFPAWGNYCCSLNACLSLSLFHFISHLRDSASCELSSHPCARNARSEENSIKSRVIYWIFCY